MSKKGRKLRLKESAKRVSGNAIQGRKTKFNAGIKSKSIRRGVPDGGGVFSKAAAKQNFEHSKKIRLKETEHRTQQRKATKNALAVAAEAAAAAAAAGARPGQEGQEEAALAAGEAGGGGASEVTLPSIPFTLEDCILLVGEGNFSFAAALATRLGSAELITATSYDSQEEVLRKYPDAAVHIATVTDLGGQVLYGVDATRLDASSKALRQASATTATSSSGAASKGGGGGGGGGPRYSKVVFNFPHAGAGIKDQAHNILSNQKLLAGFFHSVKPFLSWGGGSGLGGGGGGGGGNGVVFTPRGPVTLPAGQVLVTLKSGLPYDEWGVVEIAANAGLQVKSCGEFDPEGYPGYEHRRTIGWDAQKEGNAEIEGKAPKTWVFFDRRAALAMAAVRKAEAKRAVKQGKKANGFQGRKQPRGMVGGGGEDDTRGQGQGKKRRGGGDDSSDDE